MASYLIKVLFISHRSDNVNDLVEGHIRVLGQVGVGLVTKNLVVANLLELDSGQVQTLQVIRQ